MGKFIAWMTSAWSVILISSILLFVFWGGPVFSATARGHSERLIVSYAFIPLAVAIVLMWRKTWEWTVFAYYTVGIALIKMVVTMGVFIGASPRRASEVAKPIGRIVESTTQEGSYRVIHTDRWGYLKGWISTDTAVSNLGVMIMNIRAGKPMEHSLHDVAISRGIASPRSLSGTVGDSIIVTNHDGTLHTFSVSGDGGSLFQLPLAPGLSSQPQVLARAGRFESHCAQGHVDETVHLTIHAHPYHATVEANGVFTLDSIPPGRHEIAIYRMDRYHGDSDHAILSTREIVLVGADTAVVKIHLSGGTDADPTR